MAEGLALEDGVRSYERTRVGGSSPHLRCQGSVCRPRATKSTLRIQETCPQDRLAVSSLPSKGTVCGGNVRNCCSSWRSRGQLRSQGQLKSGNNWRNQGQLESGVTFPSTTESSSGISLVFDDLLGGIRLCPAHPSLYQSQAFPVKCHCQSGPLQFHHPQGLCHGESFILALNSLPS